MKRSKPSGGPQEVVSLLIDALRERAESSGGGAAADALRAGVDARLAEWDPPPKQEGGEEEEERSELDTVRAELSGATALLVAAMAAPACEQPACKQLPRSPSRSDEKQRQIIELLLSAGARPSAQSALSHQTAADFFPE